VPHVSSLDLAGRDERLAVFVGVQMVGRHASDLRPTEDRVPIGDGEAALESVPKLVASRIPPDTASRAWVAPKAIVVAQRPVAPRGTWYIADPVARVTGGCEGNGKSVVAARKLPADTAMRVGP
jgi:hypothetical protein